MRKTTVIAGAFIALFVGSIATAQAGTRYSFSFGIGIGPAVPYYYSYCPPYSPYFYPGYYAYSYSPYYYPYYRAYVPPRYYSYRGRYYYHSPRYRDYRDGDRWDRGRLRENGRVRSRSRSN